jgi:hypothetical protein
MSMLTNALLDPTCDCDQCTGDSCDSCDCTSGCC